MKKKLGITVTNENTFVHLLGLAKAAKKAAVDTDIFLTGEGVRLTQDTGFQELLKISSRIGVCEVSYNGFGYKKENLPELRNKDFVTQMRNAEMVEKCDRYVLL